jgi:hypothetical protein
MFIGYETLEKEIGVEGSQEYTIDIKLKPSAIELQETRVTAEKRKGKITEAPASIEIISSRDIKRESTTNMGSYLKGMKGVDFTSSGINNYSISIRGFNSSFNTRVLTLIDGRVANIPALRVINYSAVPQSMDDIDRMEVVLGHRAVINNPESRYIGYSTINESENPCIKTAVESPDRNTVVVNSAGSKIHSFHPFQVGAHIGCGLPLNIPGADNLYGGRGFGDFPLPFFSGYPGFLELNCRRFQFNINGIFLATFNPNLFFQSFITDKHGSQSVCANGNILNDIISVFI